jgi:4-hydroxy-tetrahydrodipicolinate reductase
MKIAIIGYGKMGQAIEKEALKRGHEIGLKISSINTEALTFENLKGIDVAIEFTHPATAVKNITTLIEASIPTVCGTTAWLDELPKVTSFVKVKNGALIHASNFSLGVNLFFLINEYTAKLMAPYTQYRTGIKEIHHTAKLDAPSGTAITIAEGIIANNKKYTEWSKTAADRDGQLIIESQRIDPAPGTHIVTYKSYIDTIELSHEAHSREGFAMGAVIAAEWIVGKSGVFTMRDLFGQ